MLNCAQTDALLDALMDGALTDADRVSLDAHCAECEECAGRLRLTEEMRRMFSETAPELDVPLEAQAAWRGAIRQEAARRRRRNLTRWAGVIAAALVVAVGGFLAFRTPARTDMAAAPVPAMGESAVMAENVAVVEADGQDEEFESIDIAASRAMPMIERRMRVEDLDRTCAYMADLAREYEGGIEQQRFDAGANLFVDLPAENAADFLSAAAHYDVDGSFDASADVEAEAGRVSMLLVLEEKR